MTANKRVLALTKQPVPPFVNFVTLCQGNTHYNTDIYPTWDSPYNIACLAFFNRRGGYGRIDDTLVSYEYWGRTRGSSGNGLVYGIDKQRIPVGAEYVTVAIPEFPDTANGNVQGGGPNPEDWLRLVYELQL